MTDVLGLIIERFHPILADILADDGHSEYWMKGGRGSTKSSFVSIVIAILIATNPRANAVVVRRYTNTLRDSVYNQMVWAISALGMEADFKFRVSPLEIVHRSGRKIVFWGLDDPRKAKGVKFTVGYCAIQWFEELDQVASWEMVSSALRSFKRGGDRFWTFYTYNPPRVLWSWVNKKALEMERKRQCHVDHSTYLDVVASGHANWLGDPFIEDAEYEKEANEQHYRWEFLGEVTGTGGSVFENVKRVKLTDEQIAQFDNPRNGVDWGWFPDPWQYERSEWQPGNGRLIIYAEERRFKTKPQETAKLIMPHLKRADELILCDDANPSDIRVYRDEGLKAMGAKKGNLRHQSYTWLAGLREIWIDADRCPHAFEEFSLCEYMKDRDGNWLDEFPDGNDHAIDAVRYAMMNDVRKGAYSKGRGYSGPFGL